jgi:MoxR-like ATPase/Mg-chelatase subunit ChlD
MAAASAVLNGGMHLLLEGPVGSGKTTLAAEVCRLLGRETIRVDGDDRFSDSRLAGWFDPPLVLRLGYRDETFVAGPLVRAMRDGRVLLLNELNRLPEAAQNLLLPALDEGLVQVPHLGPVRAAPGFQVVATQNPVEYVATGHLSEALRDRFEHLVVEYQSAAEEEDIVATATGCADEALVRAAVRVVRGTRVHPQVRRGSSVRGALAIVDLAGARSDGAPLAATLRAAAETALATRVELRDADAALGDVLDELVQLVVEEGADPEAVAVDLWGRDSRRGSGATLGPADAGGGGEADRDASRPDPPACTLDDRRALAQQLRAAPEDLDGWQLAGDLSAGALTHAGERAYLCAQQLAATAVLQRAVRLVGPLKAATRTVREPLLEPWGGELDVEATVENLLGKPHPEPGDLIVQKRVDRRRQVVLMIDTSLSMAGEKMALAAVAAAVLALKLRLGDLAVVLFAEGARTVLRFGEEVEPAELVRRMLTVPCGGGTDIAAALRLGHAELQRGRDPGRCGLLVSDGVYTCGADPLPAAARFGALHVLLMEEPTARREARRGGGGASAARSGDAVPVTSWISPRLAVGEAVAHAADGGLVRVDGFAALPRRMLDVADRVLH